MDIRRQELFDKFYERNSKLFKSRSEAKEAFDDVFALMGELLGAGNDVVVTGFGKFRVSHLGERNAHNPRTKEKLLSKAKNTVRFRPGALLLAAVAEEA